MEQYMSIIWIVALGAMMYFMMIRPQRKQAKEKAEMLSSLRKGDRVVTTGGVYGIIRGIREDRVTLEVASEVYVQFRKEAIGTVIPRGTKSAGTPILDSKPDQTDDDIADTDLDYEIERDEDPEND